MGSGRSEGLRVVLHGPASICLAPDDSHPTPLASYNCGTKQGAWMWISRQVRENLADLGSANLEMLGSNLPVYGPAPRRIARRHRPLYFASSTKAYLDETRNFFG